MMRLDELDGLATISVREAAEVTGFGRDQVYAAIHRGEFPALRLGHSIRVPVPQLLAWLGVPPNSSEAEPATGSTTALRPRPHLELGDHHGDADPAA